MEKFGTRKISELVSEKYNTGADFFAKILEFRLFRGGIKKQVLGYRHPPSPLLSLIFLNKNSGNGLINGNGLIMYLDEHDDDEYVVPL